MLEVDGSSHNFAPEAKNWQKCAFVRSFVRLFALCVCVCAKSSAFTSSLSLQSCRHLLVRAFILSARTTLSETSFSRSHAADDFFRIERAMCDCVVRVHHRR